MDYPVRIWAYRLMGNHVHFVAVPETPEALGQLFAPLQMRYANRLNLRRATSGHIWGDRFRSFPMDGPHLRAGVHYVENNPVRAGLVPRAEDYTWSSARPHCGLRRDPVLSPDLPLLADIDDWAAWLALPPDEAAMRRLRGSMVSGRFCGVPPMGEDGQ